MSKNELDKEHKAYMKLLKIAFPRGYHEWKKKQRLENLEKKIDVLTEKIDQLLLEKDIKIRLQS